MDSRFKFGLIGKNISYSFSKKYFTDKFQKLGLNTYKYNNYDIPEIEEFPFIIYQQEEKFQGFSVTIPYKQSIIKYLDEVEEDAQKIGAVNTIKITDDNRLIGYNTDVYGFEKSIEPLLQKHHNKALILGTGGVSKAIAYVLEKLKINFKFVSRNISENSLGYPILDQNILNEYTVIINCTPVGTYPDIDNSPNIPYEFITDKHLLFDLIYNPSETKFLQEGRKRGAIIKNGHEMLELQAEKSWEIWNS
ncbi:shikimate dehydrogenase [uncultured Lutibacter sp.]|uniref:shikimate dehydrogenase family protein n=1 Tax=uncultured Lutibacter sp. TaxID=437739 RepID=UPI00262EFC98|nr:shikimate dehydrogenase [uncultured Lutibacter sp.]